MKWKRVKGTKLVKDKVDGQLKPIMAPNVTSTNQHGGQQMNTSGVNVTSEMLDTGGQDDSGEMSDSMDDMGDMSAMATMS